MESWLLSRYFEYFLSLSCCLKIFAQEEPLSLSFVPFVESAESRNEQQQWVIGTGVNVSHHFIRHAAIMQSVSELLLGALVAK